jgi:hypothetical protein
MRTTAAANEAQHPLYAQAPDPVWVGQVADQHPQRRGVQAVGEAAGQSGEDQIELPVDLVAQHDLGGDLAAPVRDPGGLRGQCLIAPLRGTPAATDQQFGHRTTVAGVALQCSQELLAACVFHRFRVEFDDLQTGRSQPCDEGAVIVAGRLDADPDDQRVALELRASDRRGQHREAGFGQCELEWGDDDLAIVIGDQSHRGGLAYVHRYGQTALRIHSPYPGHEPRLHLAVDERHTALPSVGCKQTVRESAATDA